MVVDDEMDILLLLKKALEVEKYIVVDAYNGHDALKKVKTEIPDIILLDLMLPVWTVMRYVPA